MDVTFNNVLEGTRQYFMGLPKAQTEGSGQSVWAAGAPPSEEGALAQSGAPAAMSRPPSTAAAPPSTPTQAATPALPRPPSEPLEPEPHIIHKATVMREAAEKRREQPSPDEEEESIGALSPPSHIIRKPPPRALPSPAPAPAAPAPSPVRPPSAAPLSQAQSSDSHALPESSASYRPPVHRVQTPTARPPDLYAPSRPPDPYSTSRPPEPYSRYHYEASLSDGGRTSLGPSVASPQPSTARHSPHPQQTYARMSSTMPQHAASRLRDSAVQSPPSQRYAMPPTQSQPQHNDRVPPIHHPQNMPPQRLTPIDSRSQQIYAPLPQRRESSPYTRVTTHYDRHSAVTPRKYDPQQSYPGYRPSPPIQPITQNHRIETHPQAQYKYPASEVMNAHYARPPERPIAPPPQTLQHDPMRLPPRAEYTNLTRSVDSRNYHYATQSTSTARYPSTASVPVAQNTSLQSRTSYRPATVQKSSYEYSTAPEVQTSPVRSSAKSGYQSQQARMTVSVTTLVNQMNQTKQKRESPLDLSVKTVKNSADSSTTQDDLIDSVSMDNKSLQLQQRPSSSNRLTSQSATGYVASHKVDFAPDFAQYRERSVGHNYNNNITQTGHSSIEYNGVYETPRPISESYPAESRHQIYPDRSNVLDRSTVPVARTEYVPRIDLTRSVGDERLPESRIRDDRHLIIEDRKRPAGSIISNIPEKIVRYETWTSDSRIDRLSRSSREQHELMSRPVYSYSSHKRFEAYHNEQKRSAAPPVNVYRESSNLSPHVSHRYPYPPEQLTRESSDYHAYYHDRNLTSNSRHVIQKIPSHRDTYSHHSEPHSGVPADKRVLSILRNSLETKQTGYTETAKPPKQIPDLIVIDDVDDVEDSVIEITDLTKDNDSELTTRNNNLSNPVQNQISPNSGHNIQMPKAVDSIARDSDYQKYENPDSKSKSPENDVASRIRTKGELKVLPPSQDSSIRPELKQDPPVDNDNIKLLPKSQKQHLFNQIREDNLRLESVIKSEKQIDILISQVKSEPMNIEEIEKDAQLLIKTENVLDLQPESTVNMTNFPEEDLDWANACDSFMEQLKSGCIKKKLRKKHLDTFNNENECSLEKNLIENSEPSLDKTAMDVTSAVVIKQEPLDEDDIESQNENVTTDLDNVTFKNISENVKNMVNMENVSENKKQNESLNEITENNKDTLETKGRYEKKNFEMNKSENIIQKNSPKEKSEFRKERYEDEAKQKDKYENKNEKNRLDIKRNDKDDKPIKSKVLGKIKIKSEKHESPSTSAVHKKEKKEVETVKPVTKEESESTDDDEPLIKSKLLKEKEQSDRVKFQLMKDLTEKSAYVKLECCDVEIRKSIDSTCKDKEEKLKGKITRQMSRSKGKSLSAENNKQEKQKQKDSSSDSDDDDLCVASRLRIRKNMKLEENKVASVNKTPSKITPSKKLDSNTSTNSTPVRKPFGDGSDFHPGWEEELYRYKRSLRMPARLIAIPRGRSGGPFGKGSGALFTRGSTSLPDLDPAPLSPAPSSAPSAATDDLFARRPDKLTLDSDLDSNSSSSAANRLHYDSEASSSTVFSTSNIKKRGSSIVDVLIQKCGRREDTKKRFKDKEKTPKIIPKSSTDLLPTPSLGLLKNNNRGTLSAKKEKLMEDIFYLGAFRKETVTAYRDAFIKNTDGLIGATEEFAPVVLKSRTRTESRVLKQRATIKEVFGDERPASAPPSSCREEEQAETTTEVKKEAESKSRLKTKKLLKDKLKRRSSSIRDGLRSTQSLKRNDAKGRLLRLKKRNNLINSLANKRIKDIANNKHKQEKSPALDDTNKTINEGSCTITTEGTTKRRLKRLFGRRKFSSGFDYIRKKKKILRRDDAPNKVRRPTVKPSPESVHDIHKEIKGWFINKSVGETHLHRAARLGYTDCVAYCLEKMGVDPTAKDNAGFTPLHVAAAKGHVRITRLLLQYGANVSAAAQGGIRPLHEACENSHVEVIRLLLSYGADPLLVTYAGQTPEELAEGAAASLLRLHIADVQGYAIEPWRFPPPADIIDPEELGCDPLASPPPASPPPPPDSTIEIQCTEAPLPPFYSLKAAPGQSADGLWCLLQDITNLLQIKSKESLLKQIHCGSGSPKELLREIRTQEFLERAQCHQLLCAGEKVNVRASKVALVRVTDKLRQLLKIETVLVS